MGSTIKLFSIIFLERMNRGHKVKVLVRTRPTAHFARDMIDLQPDGKVNHTQTKIN